MTTLSAPATHELPDGAIPDEAAIIAAVDALTSGVAARRSDTYQQRRVPEQTITELKNAGLFRLLQPRHYGGYESNYRAVMQVTARLSAACPSTGWVFGVLTDHQWILSLYPEQAQEDVWAQDRDTLISSSFGPRATAEKVTGGYRLSGEWSFSSGCEHARWAMIGAFVKAGTDAPAVYSMLVPMTDIEIIDDWDVLGLNGTGSKTLKLVDVFIPEHHALSMDVLNSGAAPGVAVHPDYAMARAPRRTFTVFTLSPVMVSIAQQAFEVVVARTRKAVSRGVRLAAEQSVQLKIAEAGALIDIAATVITSRYEQATGYLEAGAFPEDFGFLVHRDLAYSTAQLRRAVEMLCSLSAGSVVYNRDPLQQLLRDAITASSHRGVNWEAAGGGFGRYALGMS